VDESTRRVFVVKAALLAVAIASPTLAGDWPGWRGPNRDGVSTEKGLLQQWGPAGPPLAWKSSGVGSGFAGVAVAGDRLFTMGDRDGAQHVFALKREGGAVLWKGKSCIHLRHRARLMTNSAVHGQAAVWHWLPQAVKMLLCGPPSMPWG